MTCKTYFTFLQRERQGVSREELGFCASGSYAAGATVNLKEPFVTDRSQQGVRSKLWVCCCLCSLGWYQCDAHNGHREPQDLVYRIVTPEAASLALFCFDIRNRKPLQPFLALQDPLPASFVSSRPWSGSRNGTWVSNVHPVSMETGRQHGLMAMLHRGWDEG